MHMLKSFRLDNINKQTDFIKINAWNSYCKITGFLVSARFISWAHIQNPLTLLLFDIKINS